MAKNGAPADGWGRETQATASAPFGHATMPVQRTVSARLPCTGYYRPLKVLPIQTCCVHFHSQLTGSTGDTMRGQHEHGGHRLRPRINANGMGISVFVCHISVCLTLFCRLPPHHSNSIPQFAQVPLAVVRLENRTPTKVWRNHPAVHRLKRSIAQQGRSIDAVKRCIKNDLVLNRVDHLSTSRISVCKRSIISTFYLITLG